MVPVTSPSLRIYARNGASNYSPHRVTYCCLGLIIGITLQIGLALWYARYSPLSLLDNRVLMVSLRVRAECKLSDPHRSPREDLFQLTHSKIIVKE